MQNVLFKIGINNDNSWPEDRRQKRIFTFKNSLFQNKITKPYFLRPLWNKINWKTSSLPLSLHE